MTAVKLCQTIKTFSNPAADLLNRVCSCFILPSCFGLPHFPGTALRQKKLNTFITCSRDKILLSSPPEKASRFAIATYGVEEVYYLILCSEQVRQFPAYNEIRLSFVKKFSSIFIPLRTIQYTFAPPLLADAPDAIYRNRLRPGLPSRGNSCVCTDRTAAPKTFLRTWEKMVCLKIIVPQYRLEEGQPDLRERPVVFRRRRAVHHRPLGGPANTAKIPKM